MQSKITNLLNYCYGDRDTDSIELQLFLITVKCLMPYEDKIGCYFESGRYEKEIQLFAHYMTRNEETVDYWLKYKKPSTIKDGLLEFKIIPLVLSNTIWENLIDEVLKAVAFYTIEKNTMLNAMVISYAIYAFMNDTKIENFEESVKEKIINFSIKDFLNKNKIIFDRNFMIEFERQRIMLIAKPKIFTESLINEFKVLNYIFIEKASAYNDLENSAAIEVKSNERNARRAPYNNSDLINNYSAYLYKLRKGIIDPEKLKVADKMPDLNECLKHSAFNHPLLGRCEVLQKTENEVIVRNKTGLMRMRL